MGFLAASAACTLLNSSVGRTLLEAAASATPPSTEAYSGDFGLEGASAGGAGSTPLSLGGSVHLLLRALERTVPRWKVSKEYADIGGGTLGAGAGRRAYHGPRFRGMAAPEPSLEHVVIARAGPYVDLATATIDVDVVRLVGAYGLAHLTACRGMRPTLCMRCVRCALLA